MLLIKTNVATSNIHGVGLFAQEGISKGTVIWKFLNGFDQKFTREQILHFPDLLQIYIATYAWKSKKSGLYCLSADHDGFMNHSDDPNCLCEYMDDEDEVVTRAKKDIRAGEEITVNYSSFEEDADEDIDNVLNEICQKFHLIDEIDPRLKKPRKS